MVSVASALLDPVKLDLPEPLRAIPRENQEKLLNGEILLQTRSHSLWGGAVTANLYLPLDRSRVWQQVTNYSRWVHYFPDMTQSQVLSDGKPRKRLYQAARKNFFLLSAGVEIYLTVLETVQPDCQQIEFQLERGSFSDFGATLELHDFQAGTLLTYSVQATPTIPVPTQLIQEAIKFDFPSNLRQMRRVICAE